MHYNRKEIMSEAHKEYRRIRLLNNHEFPSTFSEVLEMEWFNVKCDMWIERMTEEYNK